MTTDLRTAKTPRALALISGGLDSMLAAKMIMAQGVYVEGINFFTGFCGDTSNLLSCEAEGAHKPACSAYLAAKQLGINLNVVNVAEEYKKIVINPQYGYGAHLNPCLDCKIFMIIQAKKWCDQHQFDFIITGEVIGQRPKSQLKHMLPIVAKSANASDLLLRPLSAKYLKPTLPERRGWVRREILGSCCGRSRKIQIKLAKKYGLTQYAQPSGGCCALLDKVYCRRLRDLWKTRGIKDYILEDLFLLRLGRHLRPKQSFKMIVGREKRENDLLMKFANSYPMLISSSHNGPVVIIDGIMQDPCDIELVMRITARYCSHHNDKKVVISFKPPAEFEKKALVLPLKKEEILSEWFV